MEQTLSSVAYTADGVQSEFDLTFGYLSRSHVYVFVDDALASYSWVNGTRIRVTLVPNPGQIVRIQRFTERNTRLVNFADGTTLLSGDLNASDLQLFYLIQEIIDGGGGGGGGGGGTVVIPPGTATEAWVLEQLLDVSAFEDTQQYIDLIQSIVDQEVSFAQQLAAEGAARTAAIAAEASQRATDITAEADARAQAVLALEQADLNAGQRLDNLEQAAFGGLDLTALEASIANLETVVVDLENSKAEASVVAVLQADLDNPTTGLKARATALEDRVTNVEGNYAQTSTVDLLSAQINDPATGLAARATSLESRVTTIEEGGSQATDLSQLTARVDQNEADITAEQTARAAADSALTTQVDAATARIDTAEANIVSLDEAIVNESGARTLQVANVNTRVDDVETSVTDLTQTVNANDQARIDDVAVLTAATNTAQADATQALNLTATETTARINEVQRLETDFTAADATLNNLVLTAQARADQAFILASTPDGSTAVEFQRLRASIDTLGGGILKNSRFEEGFDNWSLWGTTPTTSTAVTSPINNETTSWRIRRTSGTNQAFFQVGPAPNAGGKKWKIRVTIDARSGTVAGAGVFVQQRNSSGGNLGNVVLDFRADPDTSGQVTSSRSGLVTYEKVFTAAAGTQFLVPYCGNQATLFTGYSSGRDITIDWIEVTLTPASTGDADVTELKEAITTGSSSRARLFLGVNTGNNEATLEAYAASGDGVWNGSKIKFGASLFEFNGDVIVNGSITADNLAEGAASNGNGNVVTTQITPGNAVWTTVASVTLTTVGGKVYLHGSSDLNAYANKGQSGTPYAEARLLRGSTAIRSRNAGGYWTAIPVSGGIDFAMIGYGDIQDLDNPPAGTHTYNYQIRIYNGSLGQGYRRVSNRVLTAIEFRR